MANGQGQPVDLNQIIPMLLLASIPLEFARPGMGVGLAAGALGFQRAKQQEKRDLILGLAGKFADLEDDQEGVVTELLKGVGIDKDIARSVWGARKAFANPNAQNEKYLNEIIEASIGGQAFKGPRRLLLPQQMAAAQRGQELAVTKQERGEDIARELAGQARQGLVQALLNPATPPQTRAHAQQILQALASPGADVPALLSEAQGLLGTIGEAGAAQELKGRQETYLARRQEQLKEAIAAGDQARVVRLAKILGVDPKPYLAQMRVAGRLQKAELEKAELTPAAIRSEITRNLAAASADRALAASRRQPQGVKPILTPNELRSVYEKAYDDAYRKVMGAAGAFEKLEGLTPDQELKIDSTARLLVGQRLRGAGYKVVPEGAKLVRQRGLEGIGWEDVAAALERDGVIPELYYAFWKQAYSRR